MSAPYSQTERLVQFEESAWLKSSVTRMAKMIKMEVGDVVRMTRGDSVVEVQYVAPHSNRRSEVGISADRDVRIELFRDGQKVEAVGRRSPLNPENWS